MAFNSIMITECSTSNFPYSGVSIAPKPRPYGGGGGGGGFPDKKIVIWRPGKHHSQSLLM